MTPQETDTDLPVSGQESLAEVWVGSGLLGAECSRHAWDLLKEVAIFFITSIIVWAQVKQQGANTVLPINRKLD